MKTHFARRLSVFVVVLAAFALLVMPVQAQDQLPRDNGISTYHSGPHYRESESHPLRVLGYVLHPIGWVAREVIFRPLSYFASSSETRRSVMGYRDPFDYRQPECFSSDHTSPDCRSVLPYNYDAAAPEATEVVMEQVVEPVRQVYFPDVNFDFDKSHLSDLGKGRAYQIAELLKGESGVHVVLEGHTDFIGSEGYNEKLGTKRAEAVRTELVALGVPADRLSTVTFGKSQPLLAQETDWARAVNRRVEIHVDEATAGAVDAAAAN
ncbi:MAG: OmpA family protein [Bdellovibrionales bacterium]|nr:OmpA family protein [Bdellovibrionales bacterium]